MRIQIYIYALRYTLFSYHDAYSSPDSSDSKELQSWIDTINFVCASFSSQPLAGAVGSQRKFQRPLLPCTHTKLSPVSSFVRAPFANGLLLSCSTVSVLSMKRAWLWFVFFFQREQLRDHDDRVNKLEAELDEHRRHPPERGAKALAVQNYKEKDAYLHYEVRIGLRCSSTATSVCILFQVHCDKSVSLNVSSSRGTKRMRTCYVLD